MDTSTDHIIRPNLIVRPKISSRENIDAIINTAFHQLTLHRLFLSPPFLISKPLTTPLQKERKDLPIILLIAPHTPHLHPLTHLFNDHQLNGTITKIRSRNETIPSLQIRNPCIILQYRPLIIKPPECNLSSQNKHPLASSLLHSSGFFRPPQYTNTNKTYLLQRTYIRNSRIRRRIIRTRR